ncbi:MAG: hypothetical protein ACI9KE_000398 [Polyangiales bacterium]|jgi:hypothetical protein
MCRGVFLLFCLLSVPSTGVGQCEYRGEATISVEVPHAGELNVDGAVVVRPRGPRQAHAVEARVGLSFVGEADVVHYQLVDRIVTGRGMVSLGPATEIRSVRTRDEGLVFHARLNAWIEVDGLEASCDQIMLFREAERETETLEILESGDGTFWENRRRRLRVHDEPRSRDSVSIQVRDQGFLVTRLERRGSWFRVLWTNHYNSIQGWVRREDLSRTTLGGFGTTGGSGTGSCLRGRVGFSGDRIYRGPAQLTPGAFVRETPHGPVWASVRVSEGFEVQHVQGEAWARLITAPGVHSAGACGELRRAWVRADEVVFPVERQLTRNVD